MLVFVAAFQQHFAGVRVGDDGEVGAVAVWGDVSLGRAPAFAVFLRDLGRCAAPLLAIGREFLLSTSSPQLAGTLRLSVLLLVAPGDDHRGHPHSHRV